jgi:hypothetical protein
MPTHPSGNGHHRSPRMPIRQRYRIVAPGAERQKMLDESKRYFARSASPLRGQSPAPLSSRTIQHPAISRSIVEASAVRPHFVRPKPVGVDFDNGQLTRHRDLIPAVEFGTVQNGTDCLLERSFPNSEIDDCRSRFFRPYTNKPALFCQMFSHFSNMRDQPIPATRYRLKSMQVVLEVARITVAVCFLSTPRRRWLSPDFRPAAINLNH